MINLFSLSSQWYRSIYDRTLISILAVKKI